MPKGKYVAQNRIQAEFFHFPKHQDCIIDVLTAMYENDVVPDRGKKNNLKSILR